MKAHSSLSNPSARLEASVHRLLGLMVSRKACRVWHLLAGVLVSEVLASRTSVLGLWAVGRQWVVVDYVEVDSNRRLDVGKAAA
jgi:hypothetical protein